ncbi:MAG: DEAD/DEAH box helicase [Chloroflexota bacterium]|nr:MAG: DEAD/DEAH box helicase [Chloroflexota bacterium]
MGEDLAYWIVVARFALELLHRQRFIPTLHKEDLRYLALWRPLLDEETDARRFDALVRSMPPMGRALAWNVAASAPAPRELLRAFLEATVDAVARGTVQRRSDKLYGFRTLRSGQTNSPEMAWLEALRGDPVVKANRNELSVFYDGYRAWSQPSDPLAVPSDSFRICFRLDPPTPDPETEGPTAPADGKRNWTLHYLLQATDDPSLLVPVSEVWRHRGSTARFLDRKFDHPQERLLAGLGRASRLFPPIEASLHSARPERCELRTTEAYAFVQENALLLRSSGFGVLVPGLETKLGVRVRLGRKCSGAAATGPGLLGWSSLVDYDWELALGDETLSRAEFEALARLKEPLVQVRGRWIELRPEQIAQALEFFKRHGQGGEMSLLEAVKLALSPDGDLGLPITDVSTEGWVDSLIGGLRNGGRRQELDEPPGFVGQLRGYQKTGVSWLAELRRHGLGACLADDMGLGKTIQVIALLLHQRRVDPEEMRGPTLLICPTSVVGNWRRELERFGPSLRTLVHHGSGRNREELAAEAARHDVVISTYALLHRDESELSGVQWVNVILDEAQNVKNAATKAAQTARRLRARWRAALTGTPVENRLSDLWSIFQFLNPGYLGSAEEFRKRYALPIERAHDAASTARLKALVSPFILRRLKTDRSIIQDLPEKNEMKVFCTLTREQATLYEAAVQSALKEIEQSQGVRRRGEILATLTKLKQICDHPTLFLHDRGALPARSGKLARLGEMLEEVLAVGDHALVFTQYAEMGTLLKEHLESTFGREVLFLHGGTPASERDRMVARFQSGQHGPHVFILSIRAGGTGLNLTRANHVFHFDRWWNPAVENQATDRAFRIGQSRDVQVHKFICAGTFEESIDALIESKVELSEAVVGTSEAWLTEMSTEELRNLFALRRDAVGEE